MSRRPPPRSRGRARRRTAAPPGRKPAQRRAAARPRRLSTVTRGDRPYVLGLVGLLVLVAIMAFGPLQNFIAAAERVDALTETRDRLKAEVDALQERQERLEDPEEVELLARQELGMVKPGEIPFVVVTPEPDLDELGPKREDRKRQRDLPWYRRLGEVLGDLFGG